MASFCPANCQDEELIANTPEPCELEIRENSVARFAFKLCTVSVPLDIDPGAFKSLVDDGSIVFSSEIANFAPGEPNYQETTVSDCKPPLRTINARELVFEDRIKRVFNENSPGLVNLFGDYAFWQDKVEHTFQLDVMVMYCNGDLVPAMDQNGDWLGVSVTVYLNWERRSQVGKPAVEFKRISLLFDGDPFALYNTPFINVFEAGVSF